MLCEARRKRMQKRTIIYRTFLGSASSSAIALGQRYSISSFACSLGRMNPTPDPDPKWSGRPGSLRSEIGVNPRSGITVNLRSDPIPNLGSSMIPLLNSVFDGVLLAISLKASWSYEKCCSKSCWEWSKEQRTAFRFFLIAPV